MDTCKKFDDLHQSWKDAAVEIIRTRMCGKSHIADISIEESDLTSYEFKVTVLKYNTVKGWGIIAYLRSDIIRTNGKAGWRLSFKPRIRKGEREMAGRTGSYG